MIQMTKKQLVFIYQWTCFQQHLCIGYVNKLLKSHTGLFNANSELPIIRSLSYEVRNWNTWSFNILMSFDGKTGDFYVLDILIKGMFNECVCGGGSLNRNVSLHILRVPI